MRVGQTVEQLKQQYGDDLRVVWKHLIVHPSASLAAHASCAAQKQGKFFEFEHKIWEKGWPGGMMKDISEPVMDGIATELQLDMKKFKADTAGDDCKKQIDDDAKLLGQVGAHGTPAFYINGRFLGGAQDISRFKAVIDEELKKANDAISAGTKAEDYYGKIVANGKKSVQ
jgi:protein-disulfide isomerase